MASNNVPQSMLYNSGYGSIANTYRDRSAEQQYSNSGQPMNPTYIPNFNSSMYGTQQPGLGRYSPPMLTNPYSGTNQWSSGQGGYAYNLPTSFGPYGGAWGPPTSAVGPQSLAGIQSASGGGMPQFGGGLQTGAGGQPATTAGSSSFMPQMNYNGFGAAGQAQQMQAQMPPQQPQLTAYQMALQQAQSNPAWQARAQAQMASSAGAAPSAGSAPANGWIPNFSAPYGQSPFAGIIAGMRQPPAATQPTPTPTMV